MLVTLPTKLRQFLEYKCLQEDVKLVTVKPAYIAIPINNEILSSTMIANHLINRTV